MTTKSRHSPTQISGYKAEKIASDYLTKKGLRLIAKNFTTRLGEIDLIMEDNKNLIFIEVRQRKKSAIVKSQESVNFYKRKKIYRTAMIFLQKYPSLKPCRIDVIAIDTFGNQHEINWIKDAFRVE
jgi:putative endonuclease